MPDDSDMLNSKAMYGASRSMQVLSSHVGIGSFIEYLSVASRTIVQTMSVVTGTKADSLSDVEMSLNTGGGAASVADLISATFLSKYSAKASAESQGSATGAPSLRQTGAAPMLLLEGLATNLQSAMIERLKGVPGLDQWSQNLAKWSTHFLSSGCPLSLTMRCCPCWWFGPCEYFLSFQCSIHY